MVLWGDLPEDSVEQECNSSKKDIQNIKICFGSAAVLNISKQKQRQYLPSTHTYKERAMH
jgi:hypothetical protein